MCIKVRGLELHSIPDDWREKLNGALCSNICHGRYRVSHYVYSKDGHIIVEKENVRDNVFVCERSDGCIDDAVMAANKRLEQKRAERGDL